MATTGLNYVIDEDDRLVRASDGYFSFARENGWTGVDASIGRSLWDFVAGEQPRTLLRILLRRVREMDREIELPFRCDSPGVRREMEVRIASTPSGRAVLFQTRLRSEVAREFQPLLDPKARTGGAPIEMCSWCDRFQVAGAWVEVEEAAARLMLFQRGDPPAISHSICHECSERLLAA
jgi:hypothetical protein